MDFIVDALNWFGKLPGPVMMFLMFFVFNLLLRIPINKSIRSAFMYALGLFSLSTFAFDIFLGTVVNVGNAMVENLRLTKTIVDFGTGVTPIFLSNPIVVWAISIGILTNIIMIALKLTKTLDVDIYNILYFWGMPAVLVYSNGNCGFLTFVYCYNWSFNIKGCGLVQLRIFTRLCRNLKAFLSRMCTVHSMVR